MKLSLLPAATLPFTSLPSPLSAPPRVRWPIVRLSSANSGAAVVATTWPPAIGPQRRVRLLVRTSSTGASAVLSRLVGGSMRLGQAPSTRMPSSNTSTRSSFWPRITGSRPRPPIRDNDTDASDDNRCTGSVWIAAAESLAASADWPSRSEEHTSELQSRPHLVCRLLLEKKKIQTPPVYYL